MKDFWGVEIFYFGTFFWVGKFWQVFIGVAWFKQGFFWIFKTNMFPFFVLYHLMLSGNFYNSEIRHGIFWVLFEALGIFLGFKFCPHSIIPVTWNPEYSPPPPELCVLLIQDGANVFVPKVPRVGDNLIKTGFSIAYFIFYMCRYWWVWTR